MVHPYFLSPGRHTRGDLPREVREAAQFYPGVDYQITEPLSAHPLVIEASVERIREAEGREPSTGDSRSAVARTGMVYLVGAGPGDARLLTLRAQQVLADCDVVVYDYLADPEVLSFASASAERVYAGKIGHGRHTSQHEINQKLIAHGRAGKRVVRLKGGDPFLFGRGGEEAEALYWAGVPFEVIPGVTSALAVPAYAGIPLTHRESASSVAVITGASAGDVDVVAGSLAGIWRADTIVILMGMANLRMIADELIACGKDEATPVAIIRWGTYETQLTITGTLQSIAEDAERAEMRSPAVIVIGEVVRLRERLNWFEKAICEPALVTSQVG
jgi:uroporphyrin-III C-methyltransferase